MKKKLEMLLHDGSLSGNAEYAPLYKAQQSAHRALEKSKKEKSEARQTYKDALGNGEKNRDLLFELLIAFRQAKYKHRLQRSGYQLAKYRLTRWLEDFLKSAEMPHEPVKLRTDKPKAKKAAQGKRAKTKTSEASKAPKATRKSAKKPN